MAGKYVNTDRGRRWQNADGTYAYVKPGGGAQFGAGLIEFIAPGTNQRTAELDQKNKDLSGNPVRTSGNLVSPTGGVMGGLPSDYKSTEASAFASAARHRGQMADIRGGGGDTSSGRKPLPGQDVALVPDSTLNTGGGGGNRNSSRVIPGSGGAIQKGTDMSRSFNDLLATTNTSGYQPFSSNQLPTSAASPDAAVSPKTQAITNIGPVADGQEYANNLGRQGTRGIGPVADGQVYGNVLENSAGAGTKGIGPLADGAAYAKAVEGKGKSTSRLDAALNDKAGIQSYMKKFSSGDRERAANRAFLDTERSMEALRAKEAVNGVVYANQKHYIAGENADGPAQAITRSEARDISSGRSTAAGLLESYKSRITDAQKETPAEAQDPLTPAASAVKDGFAAGAKTDFALNNNDAGTNKPGQKTIDSDFMESVDFSDPTQLAEYERRMNQLK